MATSRSGIRDDLVSGLLAPPELEDANGQSRGEKRKRNKKPAVVDKPIGYNVKIPPSVRNRGNLQAMRKGISFSEYVTKLINADAPADIKLKFVVDGVDASV